MEGYLEGEAQYAVEALPVKSVDGMLEGVRWTYRDEEVDDDGVNNPDDDKPHECETVFKMCHIGTCTVMYRGHNKLYAPSELTSLRRRLHRSAPKG